MKTYRIDTTLGANMNDEMLVFRFEDKNIQFIHLKCTNKNEYENHVFS